MMKLTFLGTGTSQGVPMIACPCEVCHSSDPRDRRLRSAALVQVAGLNIVIDAGPDFREQMLTAGVVRLDAILLTHEHKDHTGGLDDVRAYNYFTREPVDVWATEHVQQVMRHDYAYAFEVNPYPGAPEMTLYAIPDGRGGSSSDGSGHNGGGGLGGGNEVFDVKGVKVLPIRGMHMKLPVTGFRFYDGGRNGGGLAYLTDFNHIENSEIEKLRGVEVLVVNALGHNPHPSHFNLEQAIELARKVGVPRTYLTHMSHRMGFHAERQALLPEGVFLAYDGLTVEI